VLVASTSHSTLMTLICKTPSHHVCWLVWWSLTHHMMLHIASNRNIVFFNNCDTTWSNKLLLSHTMILLSLNDVTTKHLGILYFYLWIVENIIIVIDVLYYLNWLVSFFLLWFRWTTSTWVWTVHGLTYRLWRTKVFLMRIGEVLLITSDVCSL